MHSEFILFPPGSEEKVGRGGGGKREPNGTVTPAFRFSCAFLPYEMPFVLFLLYLINHLSLPE